MSEILFYDSKSFWAKSWNPQIDPKMAQNAVIEKCRPETPSNL